MIKFIGDMLIGWIIFTPTGKKVANNIVNMAFNRVKSNLMSNSDFKELMSLADVVMNGKSNDSKSSTDNGTKN